MDELTADQIRTLTRQLIELKVELEGLLGLSEAGARPVELTDAIGRVSRIDAIQQALVAIDEDEYGECRLCGEWIGFKRLSARPEAPLCLSCQDRRERR